MDASINISMEPFRAFVGDMLPSEQRTTGFATQSFFIGTGAVIASVLPYVLTNWFHIQNTAPAGQIPLSVKLSFYIGGVVFICAVIWTIVRTKEYSPDELREFSSEENSKRDYNADNENIHSSGVFVKRGFYWIFAGVVISLIIYFYSLEKELYILSVGIGAFGLIQVIIRFVCLSRKNKKRTGSCFEVIFTACQKQWDNWLSFSFFHGLLFSQCGFIPLPP